MIPTGSLLRWTFMRSQYNTTGFTIGSRTQTAVKYPHELHERKRDCPFFKLRLQRKCALIRNLKPSVIEVCGPPHAVLANRDVRSHYQQALDVRVFVAEVPHLNTEALAFSPKKKPVSTGGTT